MKRILLILTMVLMPTMVWGQSVTSEAIVTLKTRVTTLEKSIVNVTTGLADLIFLERTAVEDKINKLEDRIDTLEAVVVILRSTLIGEIAKNTTAITIAGGVLTSLGTQVFINKEDVADLFMITGGLDDELLILLNDIDNLDTRVLILENSP